MIRVARTNRCPEKSKAGKIQCARHAGHKGDHETPTIKPEGIAFFWGVRKPVRR